MKNLPLYEVRSISNIKDMIHSSASIYGEKPAFLVKPKSGGSYVPVSYTQFEKDVLSLGTKLVDMGLEGCRIALIGENRYEWAVSYLSVVNGTGIIIPLDKELPANEIRNLLVRSEATAVIFSGGKREDILSITVDLDFIKYFIDMDAVSDNGKVMSLKKLLEEGRKLKDSGDNRFVDAKIDNDAMDILLFTSGTTELSKAVMLSHTNIVQNLMAMCSMLYIDEKDTFLSLLPIHHTYECTCGFLCALYRGSTIAYCEGLRHIPKNMQEAGVTLVLGVPLIFEAMYKKIWDQATKTGMAKKLKFGIKLSNLLRKVGIDVTHKLFAAVHETFGGKLRLFISGAAGIDPMVGKGFRELGIHFVQGYGLTECSPIVALNRDKDFKDDAAGIPLPNLEVRIDEPNAEGIGEITVKGPSIMMGYYENPEANAKAFTDGWFHTGDMGYQDSDSFIHITGRKKSVIVTKNGKNIYPEEIETLLNRETYIKESMVYGYDDESSGEVIVSASIVPDLDKISEDFGEEGLSPDHVQALVGNIVKRVNKGLVTYKYIKNFDIREKEFVKTTTKKIKRYMEKADRLGGKTL